MRARRRPAEVADAAAAAAQMRCTGEIDSTWCHDRAFESAAGTGAASEAATLLAGPHAWPRQAHPGCKIACTLHARARTLTPLRWLSRLKGYEAASQPAPERA